LTTDRCIEQKSPFRQAESQPKRQLLLVRHTQTLGDVQQNDQDFVLLRNGRIEGLEQTATINISV
jgi:hypothetical protein